MAPDDDLRQRILEGNIKLHRVEAPHYDVLHPEEFNWFEQHRLRRDIARIAAQLPANALALDIGCGTGNILLKLIALGINVSGVDISEDMVRLLKSRIPTHSEGKVNLTVQNVEDFLVGCAKEYDLVTASSVLHHMPDYISTLRSAIGRIKPGGWLYIVHEPTKNALGPDTFPRKILWQMDNLAYNLLHARSIPQTEARDYRMSDYQLYHGFDEDKVARECRGLGLDVVSFVRYSSTMRTGLSCWIDSSVLGSRRHFSLIAHKKR